MSAHIAGAALAFVLAGGAAGDTIRHDCGLIGLGFDGRSGRWVGLWHQGSTTNLLAGGEGAPEIEIMAQDGPSFPSAARRLVAHRVTRDNNGWRCEIESADGPWRVTCTYEVRADEGILRRSVSVRWMGEKPVKVTGITLRIPGAAIGGDAGNFYLLPGNFPVERQRFAELVPGSDETESGLWANTTLALVHSPAHQVSLLAGHDLQVDRAQVVVEEEDGAVSIAHRFSTLARLAPGDTIYDGEQGILIAAGPWADALAGLRRLADSLHNGPPPDRPAWLDRAVIYSCHPGGSIDTGFSGAGGLTHLEARLPYLADLGCTAIWLNPIQHPAPWVYTVTDYRAIAEGVGTKEDLRRFVRSAHEHGIKILLDLVPHGPNDNTPAAHEVGPDAWTYDEDGALQHAWGGLAADYASPAWQAYMTDIAGYWVREFGVDGYRVDCAGGNGPNWKRGDGRRPSASSPLGGLELGGVVRRAVRTLNPDAALFPEALWPVFFRYGDLVYDYPFYHVMRKLVANESTVAWVRDARAWLQMQRLTYPQAALNGLVRFVENHDTVRSDELFGIGPSQALTALCVFAQGTPLIYQDQEIAFGEDLKRWLNLRRERPELRAGGADYEAVRCSAPEVFAFLRSGEAGAAVVAINFAPHEVTARLTWPREVARRFRFARVVGAGEMREHGRCSASVSVPAYRPAAILLRSQAAQPPAPSAPPAPPTRATLILSQQAASVGDGVTEYRLRLAPAACWFVNTCEGLLLDRFVDRHTAEPARRYQRLWRPLESGLWDGPGSPALGVIAADGRAVVVSDIAIDCLVDARIEDPSGRGEAVEMILRSRDRRRPFSVTQVEDGWAAVNSFARGSSASAGLASVDPLRVTLENEHCRVSVSRRRGGLISQLWLRRGGALTEVPVAHSDLYTDWGLFERGVHVGAAPEATPRLQITPDAEGVEVTFRGWLRTPSWNAVQRGYPAQPPGQYRITYRIDRSPVMRMTFGLTSETDRADAKAFFAYVLSLSGVTDWFAQTEAGAVTGAPGLRRGERLFETVRTRLAADMPLLGVRVGGAQIAVRAADMDALPQNTFVLDQGPQRLALFIAMLNGDEMTLPAGVERTVSVDLVLGE